MPNKLLNKKHQSRLTDRFKQTIWVTISLVMVGIIGTALFAFSLEIISSLLLNCLVMLLLFPLIKREKLELAKQIYLWVNIVNVSYLIWQTGGIFQSDAVLAYPMFLMVAALICNTKTFHLVGIAIFAIVAAMGVATINGLNAVQENDLGYWNLAIINIILLASGFTAWRFNSDMKHALRKLKNQVTKAKESNSEIERLIHFDPLTDLSNRSGCEEKYALFQSIQDESNDKETSFLFLDIDNFKYINDYYNHAVGDELLKKMAVRLLDLSQKDDIKCRLSGDEFLLIITRPKDYNLNQFTKEILQRISQPVEVFEHMIEITVSIGIASTEHALGDFEDTLKNADLAMYKAKELGKNKYYFYDETILKQTNRKLQIIKGLQDALKNDDLELFLQPKVDLENGKIKSAEALLRWVNNNPDNISPAEFIPLIESTELICDIGEWVISEACRLCKELHNNGFEDLAISINISSAQFKRGGLEKFIVAALQKAKLEPQFLELELTEHILFKDDADIIKELNHLKELGIALSIDDFGTGYSNLSYLSKFKVDSLKIDQSFIKDIHNLPDQFAIVDAIIKMGKSLGLTVIAEGVESNDEWKVLNKLDCDFGQGYLWAKPLTSSDFLQLNANPKAL